jgi:hypothetical protein
MPPWRAGTDPRSSISSSPRAFADGGSRSLAPPIGQSLTVWKSALSRPPEEGFRPRPREPVRVMPVVRRPRSVPDGAPGAVRARRGRAGGWSAASQRTSGSASCTEGPCPGILGLGSNGYPDTPGSVTSRGCPRLHPRSSGCVNQPEWRTCRADRFATFPAIGPKRHGGRVQRPDVGVVEAGPRKPAETTGKPPPSGGGT